MGIERSVRDLGKRHILCLLYPSHMVRLHTSQITKKYLTLSISSTVELWERLLKIELDIMRHIPHEVSFEVTHENSFKTEKIFIKCFWAIWWPFYVALKFTSLPLKPLHLNLQPVSVFLSSSRCLSVHGGGGCLPHCLLEYTPGQAPPRQTPPCAEHAGIWLTSDQYTSHWNAFLLKVYIHCVFMLCQRFFLHYLLNTGTTTWEGRKQRIW